MLGSSSFVHVLRTEAPNLTRRFFSCRCRAQNRPLQNIARDAFKRHASSRMNSRAFIPCPRYKPSAVVGRAFSCATVRSAEASAKAKPRSFFPSRSSNAVGYWLLGSAASVFGIVIFGGLTRLTESGLSITEWRPVTGSLPPMSQDDWESEFVKYKSSPEFAMLNSRMTLEEFKSIYWMEWIHRLWGRAIGITFVLPAIYFTARGKMSASMTAKVWVIAGLIGFQGFLGWWMVKSGLKDDLFAPGSTPRVSQYRLTAHLGAAFIVYLSMLWNGLTTLRDNRLLHRTDASEARLTLHSFTNPALRPFRRTTLALFALVFTTAMSGALVAGLDAGLIYNDFPWMGMGLTPPKSELFDKFYSHVPPDSEGKHSDLVWRNMFENPSLVQLDHRIMATTTFTAIMALFAWSRFSPVLRQHLPRPAKKAIHGVVGFAWLQVILGISTLMYLVPTPLASAHQAGALALLTWTFVLGSRIHASKRSLTLLEKAAIEGRLGVGRQKQHMRHPTLVSGESRLSSTKKAFANARSQTEPQDRLGRSVKDAFSGTTGSLSRTLSTSASIRKEHQISEQSSVLTSVVRSR